MVRNHQKPLKAMVATSKKHRKTIDGNGRTAQKTFRVMVSLKTVENLQWCLQTIEIYNGFLKNIELVKSLSNQYSVKTIELSCGHNYNLDLALL